MRRSPRLGGQFCPCPCCLTVIYDPDVVACRFCLTYHKQRVPKKAWIKIVKEESVGS